MKNDELDIDNFDVPILSIKGAPIRRANKSFKPLICAIERMQLTLFEIKYRAMPHQYDKDRIEHEVTTIRERAVAFYQGLPKSMRLTFWIVFAFVCLLVAAFINAVTPL